jgi:FimV-like protein
MLASLDFSRLRSVARLTRVAAAGAGGSLETARLADFAPTPLAFTGRSGGRLPRSGTGACARLGRLNVQSALGETLRAEIELTSLSPEEENGLRVRVAAPDAFRAQGLDYNAVLAGAQVQLVRQANGRAVLRIQSERAVQEPFLDLLLDIRWATGRLNREFTLLFDPPGSARAQTVQAEAAPAVVAPVVSAAAPAPGTAQPRAAAPAAPAAPPAPRGEPASAADGILVRAGDSLSRLASRYRLDGVSLEQMLVGLFRENPEAFIGSNMNLLRAGSRLRVPGRDGMAALPADEARRLVRAHSGSFDSVRQSLAAAAPKLPAEPERVARGAVQAQVSPAKPVATGGDRLTLSKPAAVASVPVHACLANRGRQPRCGGRKKACRSRSSGGQRRGLGSGQRRRARRTGRQAGGLGSGFGGVACRQRGARLGGQGCAPPAACRKSGARVGVDGLDPFACWCSGRRRGAAAGGRAGDPSGPPTQTLQLAGDPVRGEPASARFVLRRHRRAARRHARRRQRRVLDVLLLEPARRPWRRRSGCRGRRLSGLRPRPAGRGNPQGGPARPARAHGHSPEAPRGLRQTPRCARLRAIGHPAVRGDQGQR